MTYNAFVVDSYGNNVFFNREFPLQYSLTVCLKNFSAAFLVVLKTVSRELLFRTAEHSQFIFYIINKPPAQDSFSFQKINKV